MFFTPIIERRGIGRLAAELGLPKKNIRRWVDSDSIPAEWWKPVAARRVATLKELADAAEAKRLSRTETDEITPPPGEAA